MSDVEVLLDEAMQSAISDEERELLLLRYHHDESVNEVGETLGISPNTATKRLTRAVDRLRKFMRQRGADVSGAIVAETLVRIAHESAPMGLAAKAVGASTGGAVAPLVVEQITRGVIKMFHVMQMKIVAGVLAVALFGGGGVFVLQRAIADERKKTEAVQPATQPAAPATPRSSVSPATRPIANSPKEALILFAKAARAVDLDGMRSLVHITDPKEEAIMSAACDFSGANAAFLAAVNDRFGEDATKKLKSGMQTNLFESFIHSIETQLDQLTETVNGDKAVLALGETDETPVSLVKHEGSWKISATGMTNKWSEQQYAQVLAGMQRGTEVFSEFAGNLNKGQIKSFDELVKLLRQAFPGGK